MKALDLKKLTKAMEKCQDKKRFSHTIGVEYTAACMAMRYGESVKNAQIAGLLHDCAKCISDEKKLSLCKKYKLEITEVEQKNPFLLHAKLGGFLAKEKYGVEDQDIINAISNHTTGRPEMSLLEKIVFLADYIEPGRKVAPNLEAIRKLAFEDIDKAMCKVLEDTLQYLKDAGKEIDQTTKETYDYYKSVKKGKKA